MAPFQYITIVAEGGVPVRLANQDGTPYPTTGTGALVFNNLPDIYGATLHGVKIVDSEFYTPMTTLGDLYYFGEDGPTRLPMGESGQSLTASPTGLVWGNVNTDNVKRADTLAALKALLERPDLVQTEGFAATADGGGGLWAWIADDTTTPDDGTVVQPTAGPPGRYKRIYNGEKSLRWYGCKGDGVTNDTALVVAALQTGGEFIVEGNYLISSVIATVNNLSLIGMPGAKFTSIPGSTNDMMRLVGDDNRVEKLTFDIQQSPLANSALRPTGHRTRLRSIRIIGAATNYRTPQIEPGPAYGLLVQPSLVPYAALEDVVIEDLYVQGCVTGCYFPGSRRAKINNVTIYGTYGMGMVAGGVTTYDFQMTNYLALCCGLYGFSNAALFWGASYVEAVPMYGWSLIGMRAENCGWMAFFGPAVDTSDVGSTKYGYDITDNGLSGFRFIGSAKDCAAGGLEDKGGSTVNYDKNTTTSGATVTGATVIPVTSATNLFKGMKVVAAGVADDTYIVSVASPNVTISRPTTADMASGVAISFLVNIQPPGHNNAVFDMQYVSHLDSGQQGIGVYQEDPTILAGSWSKRHYHKCHAVTEQAPPWRSLILQRPMDVVAANGQAWLCMGNATDGFEGQTGQITPPAGATYLNTTANGTTAAGNTVINVNSTTGLVGGEVVYALNVPDGATVVSFVPGISITISTPTTGPVNSGRRLIIGTMHFDGGMYWFCRGADTSGASTANVGVQSYGVTNYVFDVISDGNGTGVRFDVTGGSDDKYLNGQCTARVRNSVIGIQVSGTGSFINGTFSSCDVEASAQAFYVTATGVNDFTIDGGKFKNTGAGSQQGLRFTGAGTHTVRIDGGAYFVSGQYAVYADGGTLDVKCGHASFEGGIINGFPVQFLGTSAGVWDWGNAVLVNRNPTGGAGWRTTAGTVTTRGRALRQDMTVAPIASTRGNVGEYMILAAPTATEQGYRCWAANFGTTTFSWVPFN